MNELLAENNRRIALYFRQYDRITGDPQGEVVPRSAFSWNGTPLYLPVTMTEQPIYRELCHTTTQAFLRKYTGECTPRQEKQFFEGFIRDRLRHDFEFWAYTCVKIQDELTKRPIPFSLNRGQRRLVAKFEEMRRAAGERDPGKSPPMGKIDRYPDLYVVAATVPLSQLAFGHRHPIQATGGQYPGHDLPRARRLSARSAGFEFHRIRRHERH